MQSNAHLMQLQEGTGTHSPTLMVSHPISPLEQAAEQNINKLKRKGKLPSNLQIRQSQDRKYQTIPDRDAHPYYGGGGGINVANSKITDARSLNISILTSADQHIPRTSEEQVSKSGQSIRLDSNAAGVT